MRRTGRIFLLGLVGLAAMGVAGTMRAQGFGSLIVNKKKIVLVRKLPPTGHIEGTTFKVAVDAKDFQADLATDMKSTLESLLIRDDARLRSEDVRPETTISCRITSYSVPQPQKTTQAVLGGKGNAQTQQMQRITGMLTVSFQAKDRGGKSLAADNVTAKFDREYPVTAQPAIVQSMGNAMSHMTKGGSTDDNKPPTQAELHNRLIQEASQQIAAHLVNTTEQVDVYLAKGGGLDQANKLMEGKLWSRALEQLETMKPFPKPEDDAYRMYDLGVVNEAMAYAAEDVQQARKELQEASIDYGKAIDAKPTEKYFLQPQTRIDTALAHYKVLGDQKAPVAAAASAGTATATRTATVTAPSTAAKAPAGGPTAAKATGSGAADAMTNEQVISMVAAGMDDTNIIDTIKHAKAVNFDFSVAGQVELSKNKVSGQVLTAMKARARAAPAPHHVAATPAKSSS